MTNETDLSQQKPSVAFEVKVSEIQPRLITTAVAQLDHRTHVAVINAAAVRPLHRPALIRRGT